MSDSVSINALAGYVPDFVKHRLTKDPAPLTEPSAESFTGAVLFADIKGFTQLTERLARRSLAGAEAMTYFLNVYVEEVIDLIIVHGGDIVKFAGDALVVIWPMDQANQDALTVTLRAVQTGLLIQAMLHDQKLAEGVRLSLQVGIGFGEISVAYLGGIRDRWEYLISGDPLMQMGIAEKQAEPGQVIVSPEAWAVVAEQVIGTKRPDESGFFIQDIRSPLPYHVAPDAPLPEQAEQALRSFIPRAILSRLTAGHSDWLAELRRVTVLFINLPQLDHKLPLARSQALMQALQTALYRHEGRINKLSVDDKGATVVAALGLPPLSHEDDPSRGIQAALTIQTVLRQLAIEGAIGVATGWAFCGVVGSERRREYTMIGDIVNLAARLMQVAPVHTRGTVPILCDEETYQATQNTVRFKALSPILVKGKESPVSVFEPMSSQDDRHGLDATNQVALIGRVQEQAVLRSALDKLQTGEPGAVILIEGEAGIGKSKLVDNLYRQANQVGVMTVLGKGASLTRELPYRAWQTIFGQLLSQVMPSSTQGNGTDQVGQPAARIEWAMTALKQAGSIKVAEAKKLRVALTNILSSELSEGIDAQLAAEVEPLLVRLLSVLTQSPVASEKRLPLTLIMEDAQWLDDASWQLIWRASQEIEPLLLVIVTRLMADPLPVPYWRLLHSTRTQRLKLDIISPADTAALVATKLQVPSISKRLADLIYDKAEGQPFFSEALAYSLRASNLILIQNQEAILNMETDGWQAATLPASVRGIITSLIDRLSPAQQFTLKVASVIGRMFTFRVLFDIHPVEDDKERLREDLTTLTQLGMIRLETPEPNRAYFFEYGITQDVAYNLMLFSQRRQLHRAVAEWYEANYGDDLAPFYSLLAHHWSRAAGLQSTDPSEDAKSVEQLQLPELGATLQNQRLLMDKARTYRQKALQLVVE